MSSFSRIFRPAGLEPPDNHPLRLLYLVHQFYPEFRNGTEKFVLQLARSMQARGHQAQVVTYGCQRWRRWWRWLGVTFLQERYTYGGVPVLAFCHAHRPPNYHHQIEDQMQEAFARRFLRRWRPDLVHVGHAMRMSGFVEAAQELGIPTVLTLTDYWLICPKFTLINSQGEVCHGPAQGVACQQACAEFDAAFIRRRLALAEQIARRATAVVAPSMVLAEVFRREWPWLAPQIVLHGVAPWTHNRRLVGPESPLVFAYAGSLTSHKGVHILLEAFAGVESATARLLIYGAGPDEAALRAQAAADPRVHFCGIYDESNAGQVFSAMDVLVVPSLWPENRPFVVHEALASGVPVIASDAGGMAGTIEDGVTGFVVPPGDSLALQAVLQAVVDRPQQLNAFKVAIQALAIPTVATEADAYGALYRKILGRADEATTTTQHAM
jgi:glycosyltransferase involved in cell wall biosynthesis